MGRGKVNEKQKNKQNRGGDSVKDMKQWGDGSEGGEGREGAPLERGHGAASDTPAVITGWQEGWEL